MGETLVPSILRGWWGGFDNNGCCWSWRWWIVPAGCHVTSVRDTSVLAVPGEWNILISMLLQNPPTHLLQLMTHMGHRIPQVYLEIRPQSERVRSAIFVLCLLGGHCGVKEPLKWFVIFRFSLNSSYICMYSVCELYLYRMLDVK